VFSSHLTQTIAAIATAKLIELCYKIPHFPYSSDLASSDYLFPYEKWFAGKKFGTNYEMIDKTNTYFAELNKSHYMDGIKKIENCWMLSSIEDKR